MDNTPADKKIRVLIVDDSATIQHMLNRVLSVDSSIEIVGRALNPFQARELLLSAKPDVMLLDINMPQMDGLTFLKKVMEHFPVPTIIMSTMIEEDEKSGVRAKALELGAVDVIAKDTMGNAFIAGNNDVVDRVKKAALVKMA